MKLLQLCLFLLASLPFAGLAQGDEPVEVLVVGRQPGPPLWQVYNGDNVLWIFPYLSPVPQGMVWETDKVAQVLAQSQEVLGRPDIDVSASPLLMLNPINIFRGLRLAKRLSRNPEGATLAEVLPVALYQRYENIKQQYFPRDDEFDRQRPLLAGNQLLRRVQREEGLVSGQEVGKQLQRLIRRNRGLQRTDIELDMRLSGSYRELAGRAETMMNSLSREQELACFESRLARAENDIREMKIRANAWAQGYIDEFRGIPLPGDNEDACVLLLVDSSEFGTIQELRQRMDALWLEQAERALAGNNHTFAVLDINDLILEDGLLAQLRAKGYTVREP